MANKTFMEHESSIVVINIGVTEVKGKVRNIADKDDTFVLYANIEDDGVYRPSAFDYEIVSVDKVAKTIEIFADDSLILVQIAKDKYRCVVIDSDRSSLIGLEFSTEPNINDLAYKLCHVVQMECA